MFCSDDKVPLLEACGLGYRVNKDRPLVSNVDLTVREGDTLAIIGPNGAGKSTLLNMLCGFLAPSEGAVYFQGRSLSQIAQNKRARSFAVVSQHHDVDCRLKLCDYIALGRIPYAQRRNASKDRFLLDKILEKVSLTGFLNRLFGDLSGGERQRAILARALIQEPEILFLDEPTNHLDPVACGELLRLVRSLSLTNIMILHDFMQIVTFASHTAFLKEGKLFCFDRTQKAMVQENLYKVFGMHFFEMPHPEDSLKTLFFDIPSPH